MQVLYLLFERAVKAMPGCYKLWKAYLQQRTAALEELSILDPEFEATNAVAAGRIASRAAGGKLELPSDKVGSFP